MSYFLTDDNTKLYYETTGEGNKTILFIHGWSANHLFFKKQIQVLKNDYKVVSYDLRGHGLSEEPKNGYTIPRYAQDLKNLIDYFSLKSVVLVGWSMGTDIIFDYIKQFGCDNVEKIIIMDMTARLITDENYKVGLYGKFSHEDNLNTMVAMNENWKEFVNVFVPAIFAKSGCKNKEDLKWTYEEENKNSATVMTRMWVTMSSQDYRDILPKITVPTLITFGEESGLYPRENSEYLRDMIKGSKMVGFSNCGHSLMLEDPDKFNNEVKNFVG
ncbi:alpha/beta hydrolase (plasmid) [Clostridium estertheticum]|uniref:alpha/beta fold hydrolase n=1 Tax=Clostridium estertheticum TaxID=238834 RepID=UPI001C0CB776|nr:alpha/beta hydrolase [Clostridium estertheticum]MBU3217360.1 alpha/beta hydrolase [Clostridium estertheticum]WAG58135.1 alpha/beta hydrolase [Clostridium estertheticum]